MLKSALWDMSPKNVKSPACQEVVWEGKDVDLTRLPIQTCWPGDVAPLLTWGLVITRGPNAKRQNLGIYRQQLLGPNKLIMRWLSHRGGALDFRDHAIAHPGTPFPIAVALGADPATTLGAVTPVPDSLSEYQFAGLLRGSRTEVAQALGSNLSVPAWAEIVLEGHLLPASDPRAAARRARGRPAAPGHRLRDGAGRPYGDHTGYNERDWFPVFTVERITMRRNPIYHSTYTGKPPDEPPAVLGVALNECFVPPLRRQPPEIVDSTCRPKAAATAWPSCRSASNTPATPSVSCSACGASCASSCTPSSSWWWTRTSIRATGRKWFWAMTTRMDPVRDTLLVENTPIDYLTSPRPSPAWAARWGWTPPTNGRARPAANGARPS